MTARDSHPHDCDVICWCCRPIGPARPEPFEPRSATEIQRLADEMVRAYYEVHPDPAASREKRP